MGLDGICASSLPFARCVSYCFASPALLCVPGTIASRASQRRISREQNARTGPLASLSKSPIPCETGTGNRLARNPFRMLPPETDETVVIFGRMPNSFSLRTAPRWNRVARKPPPERLRPTEFGMRLAAGR